MLQKKDPLNLTERLQLLQEEAQGSDLAYASFYPHTARRSLW